MSRKDTIRINFKVPSQVKDLFKQPAYNTLKDRIKKSVKHLSGGRSNYMPQYKYQTPKTQKLKLNSTVPQSENVKAPNGTKWVNKTTPVQHRVYDMENSDVFNDFDGNFFLEKIGNQYHCWINVVSSHPIDGNGQPDAHTVTGKKICENKYTDTDNSHGFTLASVAAYFAKHNIWEDGPQKGYPHVYHDIDMGCGAVKYWNIIDGGYSNASKPHIIAHKGETVIIDTSTMHVTKLDGTDLTKYTSFSSLFPPLFGGRYNHINFYPTVGSGCDVNIIYVPRIR